MRLNIITDKKIRFKIDLTEGEVKQLIGTYLYDSPSVNRESAGIFDLGFLPGEEFIEVQYDIETAIEKRQLSVGSINSDEVDQIIAFQVKKRCPVEKVTAALTTLFIEGYTSREVRFEIQNVMRDQASVFGAITTRAC